jgi:hypothetical protein
MMFFGPTGMAQPLSVLLYTGGSPAPIDPLLGLADTGLPILLLSAVLLSFFARSIITNTRLRPLSSFIAAALPYGYVRKRSRRMTAASPATPAMSCLAAALILLSLSALTAGQADWIKANAAAKARTYIKSGDRLLLFCKPCRDKSPRAITVRSAAKRSVFGSYYQVFVNETGLDIAYVYVRRKGRWHNLARLVGLTVRGVATVIDDQGRAVNAPDTTTPPDRAPAPPRQTAANKKGGAKVLAAARQLAFVEKKIIRGSCWDFVHAVYTRAGFPQGKRHYVFRGKKRGPYADPAIIQPGDWLYHVNLEYHNVEHSCIFVRWLDRRKRLAQTIDYAGMKRREPGKRRRHRLVKVFTVIRAGRKKK